MKKSKTMLLFLSISIMIFIALYGSGIFRSDEKTFSEQRNNKKNHVDQLIQWGNEAMKFPKPAEGNHTNYSKEIKIAILDSGVDLHNEALIPYIAGSYHCLSSNRCDDIKDHSMRDPYGHGTKIARIITSSTPPNIKIIPIQIIDDYGNANIKGLIDGMNLAIKKKVDIINLSLQIDEDVQSVHDVVKKAHENNITVVASSGNQGKSQLSFPAKYEEVIAVGSVNQDLKRSEFSQYGHELDFSGPGEMSPNGDDGIKGTSYASAFVTKAIALYYLKYRVSSSTKLLDALHHSTIDLGNPGKDPYTGYGMVNVTKLLN